MKFPDSVFDSLPIFHDKIKVSVRKIMKTFEYLVRIAESKSFEYLVRTAESQ